MKTLLSISLFFTLTTSLLAMDLGPVYHQQLQKNELTEKEINKLKTFKVLIAPGILAESFDSHSGNQIKVGFIFEQGFREQLNMLKENGIDHEYLSYDTESSSEINAVVVARAIETSKKPVIIYSHSKGGLDVLESIRQNPSLVNKIQGWVSVQSPFWGAPFADIVHENKIIRDVGMSVLNWLGGDIGSLNGLTVKKRLAYMKRKEMKTLINEINSKINFINYASIKKNTAGLDTPLEMSRNLTDKMVGDNDGVVPLKSALMKDHGLDVDYIVEEEVDHFMTMTNYRPDNWKSNNQRKFSQRDHLMALLKMLL